MGRTEEVKPNFRTPPTQLCHYYVAAILIIRILIIVSFGLVWACPTKSGLGPLVGHPSLHIRSWPSQGLGSSIHQSKTLLVLCSIGEASLRGRRCRLSVFNRDCFEGSCVHQELSFSGLRRGVHHHVACWIRPHLQVTFIIIGRFVSI